MLDDSALSERKELEAFARFFNNVGRRYRKCGLVQAALEDTSGASIETFRHVCNGIAAAQSSVSPVDLRFREIRQTIVLIEKTVGQKEARTFKQFVYDCAVVVARAHKENPLPFASPVSHTEHFYLRQLGRALDLKS